MPRTPSFMKSHQLVADSEVASKDIDINQLIDW